MLPVMTGLIYGAVWYAFIMFLSRYMTSKGANIFLVGVVPFLLSCPLLLSVLLLSPMVENWHNFIRVWGLSFGAGALMFKFGIAQRYYR